MKFNCTFKRTVDQSNQVTETVKPEVPEGLLKKCNVCKSAVFVEEVKDNDYICPHCGNYFRVHAWRRVEQIADPDFEEPEEISANYLGSFVLQCAGLEMTDYNRFLLQMRKKVPAIGMCGIRNADGSFIAYKDLDSSVFRDYKMLQYLRVQDRDPKLTSIFDVSNETE